MRKHYLIGILFLSFFSLSAQEKAVSFNVNGLKVIFKPTQKETISVAMYYRGGITNYQEEQAGIENLALASAASCGTKKYSVTDFKELEDEFGITIGGSSEKDFGAVRMSCVSKYFDRGWQLFSEAIINPVFEHKEFKVTQDRILSEIQSLYAEPESRLEQLTMNVAYYGTSYNVDPMGTEETIKGFTADSIKHYYQQQLLNKNKMFLVVAGKISREDLENKIKASFGRLPEKPYTPHVYQQIVFDKERLFTEQRNLATNYMCCVLNAPPMASPDFHSFLLVINALSGSLYNEVRVNQGLSYAPGATVKLQQIPYATMYVSTTDPRKSFLTMITQFKNIKEGKYSAELIEMIKKDYMQKYYRHQESSRYMVSKLGMAEVFGDYKMEEDMISNLNKVTLQSMHDAFSKYINGAIWVYLGDEKLAKEAFK